MIPPIRRGDSGDGVDYRSGSSGSDVERNGSATTHCLQSLIGAKGKRSSARVFGVVVAAIALILVVAAVGGMNVNINSKIHQLGLGKRAENMASNVTRAESLVNVMLGKLVELALKEGEHIARTDLDRSLQISTGGEMAVPVVNRSLTVERERHHQSSGS